MNFYSVFLLPSILGIKLFMNFNKEKKTSDFVIYYLLLVLFSNLIAMIILILLNKGEDNLVNLISINYIFAVKYMSLTLVSNVILSILFSIISKYFTFTIEVENGRKVKNKNTKKSN